MIQILSRWTGAILYSAADASTIAEAVQAAVVVRADLTGARLTGARLTGARLTGARLTDADLTGADLTGARLTGARLTDARLTRADLTGARLTDADLTGADLTRADLTRADLTGAGLTRARLTGARLTDAKQPIITIQGSRHQIIAIAADVRIGCERHTLAEWLDGFERIGQEQDYTPNQIAEYGLHLRHVAAWLEIATAARAAQQLPPANA